MRPDRTGDDLTHLIWFFFLLVVNEILARNICKCAIEYQLCLQFFFSKLCKKYAFIFPSVYINLFDNQHSSLAKIWLHSCRFTRHLEGISFFLELDTFGSQWFSSPRLYKHSSWLTSVTIMSRGKKSHYYINLLNFLNYIIHIWVAIF